MQRDIAILGLGILAFTVGIILAHIASISLALGLLFLLV